jgi:carbamoyltransferase
MFMEATRVNYLKSRFRYAARMKGTKAVIAEAFGIDVSDIRADVHNVEHHKAHLGSTFLVSPLDTALCVSVDGFGDYLSTMRGRGRGNTVEVCDWVEFPHSLGLFYTAFTQFLGFWKHGDEYKVMGLSAFGKPVYLDEMRKVLKLKKNGLFELDTSFFVHHKHRVAPVWENGERTVVGTKSPRQRIFRSAARVSPAPATSGRPRRLWLGADGRPESPTLG